MAENNGFAMRTMKRKNVKGLALSAGATKPLPPTVKERPESMLEIGVEYRLNLKSEDIAIVKELGAGNGGTVSKVKHIPTNITMARKVSRPRCLLW